MGNMSYCRFENTARDLEDCVIALQNNDLNEYMSVHEVNGLAELQLLGSKLKAKKKAKVTKKTDKILAAKN